MSTSFDLSNEVTRDPAVINIITKALLDVEDEYITESISWPNGTHSDVVLVPKSTDSGLSPIIVEVQQNVNKKTMKQVVEYCLQAYKRFEVEPILLVMCIESLSIAIKNDLNNCDDLPCYTAVCDYWADHCYIVDKSSIECHITSDLSLESNLNPFAAYCLFLTTQAKSIDRVSREGNSTMKMLYRILQDAYPKILNENSSMLKNLNNIYHQKYKKVLTMLTDDNISRDTIKEYVSKSLPYNIQQKRKFDELTSEDYLSKGQDSEKLVDIRDLNAKSMKFVEIFKKERIEKGVIMDWKLCFSEGKRKIGWKYKNEESLKAQFYKYFKKKKYTINSFMFVCV